MKNRGSSESETVCRRKPSYNVRNQRRNESENKEKEDYDGGGVVFVSQSPLSVFLGVSDTNDKCCAL